MAAVLLFVLLCGIDKVVFPVDFREEIFVPKEIEGKQWNRWTSKNFVVLAINDDQAQYLYRHLELVKTWIFTRWGLPDVSFTSPCKLVCVDDPVLFEKMFKIKSTKVEIRRVDGKIKETIIFMLINGPPSNVIPIPLTEVCMAEFCQSFNIAPGWWFIRGMALLDGSISQISSNIAELNPYLEKDEPMYFSKGLLEMTYDTYSKEIVEKKNLFDKESMVFCLMIRKEYGQDKFHQMIKTSGELGVKEVLKFKDYGDLDKTFKRYMFDLVNDVVQKRTPDKYLQIREKTIF